MRCDVIAEGVVAAAREVDRDACRWWCGWKAPTSTSARRSCEIRACQSSPAKDLADAAEKVVAAVRTPNRRREESEMAVLIDKDTRVICQGFTGTARHVPFGTGTGLRHQGGGRRHARQGR